MMTSILHQRKWFQEFTNSKICQNIVHDETDQSLGRELGDYEKLLAMSHDRGNQVFAGFSKIASKEVLCIDQIRATLKILQNQQPMLRMTIQKSEQLGVTRYHFVEMRNPYVNFAVPETNDFDSVVAEQIMERFDVASGPLWRVRLVKQPHPTEPIDLEYPHPYLFVFAFHHGIADGMSFGFLIGTFLYYLSELHAGKSMNVTPMDMPPPMDFYLEPVLKKLKNEPLEDDARYFQVIEGEPNAFIAKYSAEILRSPSAPIETRKLQEIMSQMETLSLFNACKKNSATVTGALIAASCIVMADLLNAGGPFQDVTIPIELPVNMRPYVPDPPQRNNCLLFVLPLILNIRISKGNRDNFWNFTKVCTLQLQQAMKDGRPFKTYLDIKERLKSNPVLLRTGDEQGVRITPFLLKISNSIGGPHYHTDLISMKALSFGNGNHMDGAVYYLITHSSNDIFYLHMSYYPHISTREKASDFFNNVMSLLLSNCEVSVHSKL